MSVTRLSLYETLGECLSIVCLQGWIQGLEKGGVQGRAFFYRIFTGGQCPKRALQMVKMGSLRIINDYLHNP